MQLKLQFDVVDAASDLSRYRLLILPDAVPVNAPLARKLGAYVRTSGAVLASGTSGLNPAGTRSLLPMLGIHPHGMSPFTTTYVRFGPQIARDVPNTEHVIYDPGVRDVRRAKPWPRPRAGRKPSPGLLNPISSVPGITSPPIFRLRRTRFPNMPPQR